MNDRVLRPRASGILVVTVFGLSCIAATIALPTALRLPKWVEAEAVVAGWGVLLFIGLWVLIHGGFTLSRGYEKRKPKVPSSSSSSGDLFAGLGEGSGCLPELFAFEGFMGIIVGLLLIGFLTLAATFLWEAFLPFVGVVIYGTTVRILRFALFKLRRLKGRLILSGAYALGLSAIGVAPFALAIWLVQLALPK